MPVFSPLSHGLGRRQVWRELARGGRLAFLDPSNDLLEQLALFEPTSITAVPSFFGLLQRRFERELGTQLDGDRAAAMRTVRLSLGRRLIHVSIGGALVPRPLLLFLEACLGIGGTGGGNCVVKDGYGTTGGMRERF